MFRLLTLTISTIGLLVAGLMTSSQVHGQAVFLPSFRNFTYRGSVSVPDGGSIVLGGVSSSSEGSVASGVPGLSNLPMAGRAFGNRAIGREANPAKLVAKADIIIMEEIEAQMLADAAARNPGLNQGVNADVLRKAAFLSKHIGRNTAQAGQQGSRFSGDRR